MTRQWLRRCLLSLSGQSGASVPGGGDNDLHIQFAIGMSVLQSPGPAKFSITNPSPQLVTQFQNKEFQTLAFDCGYEDNIGRIYVGDVMQSLYRHEENVVDSTLTIFCSQQGNAYQQARVGSTLAAGWTPRDKVDLALKAMAPHGISGLGLVNIDLDNPKYPRGRPFIGMARDLLRQVALSAGATWWLSSDGKLNMLDHLKPFDGGGDIVLNSESGLVGFSEQTEDGVVVRCLINPAIKEASVIRLDESSIVKAEMDNYHVSEGQLQRQFNIENTGRISADGRYHVAFLEIEGDTKSQPWYQTLTCIGTGAALNEGQLQSYAGPDLYTGDL